MLEDYKNVVIINIIHKNSFNLRQGQNDKKPKELLNYNMKNFQGEDKEFYISASNEEITEMMNSLGIKKFSELYDSISSDVKFGATDTVKPLSYEENLDKVKNISAKNNIRISFVGDSLRTYSNTPK